PQEAREALDEAVRVFLLTAADLGTLDQVLEESGYERQGERWVCPAFVTVERHELALAVQRCATATGNLRPLQSFGGATTRRIFD
ncbi:MAG TPA: hypothetical protein VGR07_18975, partial [Thermoanaerobaculia bacterium]|nr:hypothetical protein [Thermoanaerobaculia bacterium]